MNIHKKSYVLVLGAMLLAAGCNHNAASNSDGTPSSFATPQPVQSSPSNSSGGFPKISLSYLNPSTVNPLAFSYQMADYDAKRNQVLFYPYGGVLAFASNSGLLLTYNVGSNNFTSPSSWTTVRLK